MRSILCLHMFRQPKQTKLVLKRVQPLFYVERLFSFFEYWRLGVMELFKITILIRLWPLTLIETMCLMLRHGTHGVSQSTLTFNKHGQQISWLVVVEDPQYHYPHLCPSAYCVTSAEVQQ